MLSRLKINQANPTYEITGEIEAIANDKLRAKESSHITLQSPTVGPVKQLCLASIKCVDLYLVIITKLLNYL